MRSAKWSPAVRRARTETTKFLYLHRLFSPSSGTRPNERRASQLLSPLNEYCTVLLYCRSVATCTRWVPPDSTVLFRCVCTVRYSILTHPSARDTRIHFLSASSLEHFSYIKRLKLQSTLCRECGTHQSFIICTCFAICPVALPPSLPDLPDESFSPALAGFFFPLFPSLLK